MDTAELASVPVQIGLLGPLQLTVGGEPIEVAGKGRRAVLALLAMANGQALSSATIIDALWPDDPPETGAAALQSHISRLRRTLGSAAGRLRRVGRGYALQLRPDELDVATARRAAVLVSAQLHANPALAAREAATTLALWRGQALEEFGDVPPLAADAVGLTELHQTLRDDALEARLALGDRTVAADAATAVAADPLRERTVTLLLRSLAADGRVAEAMEAAAAFRRRLVDETGLDPGPDLSALESRIAAGALTVPRPSAAAPPLPAVARPRSPMVGRDRDREELHRLLELHSTVTVTGPGGVGKTRLVLDVAADLAERDVTAVLVALATVTDSDRVPDAVASALALRTGAEPSVASVVAALAGQRLLLVLDNCEHVVAACRELVSALEKGAPEVRVLATSRVTLHAPGEYVVRLQPLPLPRPGAPLDELARQPGIRAFFEHAQRRSGEFTLTPERAEALVEVIRRLDGLPLAIELAAGQLAVLPVGALHDRLGRALDLLVAERPQEHARHRTLRSTIGWSYQLLGPDERSLLCALAPFPGGVDLDTVELLGAQTSRATDPLVLLSRLVDASLVAVDQQSAARYTLLDTVRAFLLDELSAIGGRTDAEERFLRWAERTATSIGQELHSENDAAADRRLRTELANLRAARDLARRRGDLERRITITLALDRAGLYRGMSELWSWSRELAADPALSGHPLEAAVLGAGAEASWLSGDLRAAETLAQKGLATARERGVDEQLTLRCWSALATVALFQADFDTSLSRRLRAAELSERPSTQLATAAMAAGYAGDHDTAATLLARARAANERQPSDADRAYYHYAAGEVAEDPRLAVREYTRARELASGCGAGFVEGLAAVGLATAWTSIGDVGQATDGFLMLLDYWPATGNQTQLWTTVRNAALLLLDHGGAASAALMLAAADAADSASAIGGHSGDPLTQAFDRLDQLVDGAELTRIRAEAAGLSIAEVLRTARAELERLRVAAVAAPMQT